MPSTPEASTTAFWRALWSAPFLLLPNPPSSFQHSHLRTREAHTPFPPHLHPSPSAPHFPSSSHPSGASHHPQARVCGSSDSRARALRSVRPRRQRHPPPHFGGRCGVPPFSSSPIPPPPSSTVAFAHVKPTPPSLLTCIHPPRPPTSRPPPTPQVLATIHRHECVAAVIAGHAHFGAYALDARGIHHRILEGAVECPPGTVAFGHVDVYPDRLCIIGTDRMLCTEMKFPCRPGAPDL
ncbi:unnamed protein product [Closterium sp. NIES-54]